MKKITLIVAMALSCATTFGQDAKADAEKARKELEETDITKIPDGWKKTADVLFGGVWTNTDKWQGASDKYNITGTANVILKADQKKGRALWLNELRWVYGGIMAPSTGGNFRKSQDQLLASSMYAPQIKPKWFWGVKFNLNTQVMSGKNYDANGNYINRNSSFMAPGTIRLGVGVLYRPQPNFKLYFSPLTASIYTRLGGDNYFSTKDAVTRELFNVDAGKSVSIGIGAMLTAEYYTTIMNNVNYKTRLDVFTNYAKEPFVKNDIDWLNSFNFNLTKNISVGAVFNIRHYPFLSTETQYMHTIGLSGAFKLNGLPSLSSLKNMVK
jgi:Protein of unknown function (DUF3078)